MRTKQIMTFCLLLLLPLWTGCKDDPIESLDPLPKKGIVVKLTTGQLETKTHLYSQSNWHHVTRVYAILYHYDDTAATEIDPDKTVVVSSQLLKKDDAPWNPSKEDTYGEGQPQTETFELELPQEEIMNVPGKYMILCVGLDDASGLTYGLTYADDGSAIPTFAEKGAKLSAAYAALAKEAATEPTAYEKDKNNETTDSDQKQDKDLIAYGQPDIAHSELFAGWQAFDFMPDDLNVVEVELRRRVAGVLCYLSEIPYKLNVGTTTYRVTKVRLNLHSPQNGQISLMRQLPAEGKPSQTDFGKPADGKTICQTLCEFDLMSFTPQPATTGGDLLYQIPTTHLDGRKQLENTILMGTYVLPIAANDANATLEVELLGYEYDDSSTDADHIKDDKGPEKVEATLIKSFPAIYDGLTTPERYSLLPNMIYHIGQKLDNNNTDGDYPESLAGTKVTIQADPWDALEINVEFPSVPINTGITFNEGSLELEPEKYIIDCIGSKNRYNLKINSSILYDDWELTAVLPQGFSEDKHWLYFWDESKNEYVTKLEGRGTQTIYVRMDDYASVADWQQGYKTREVILTLTAKDEDGVPVSDAESKLKVEQYNALIVQIKDDGYRGFSHFDMGTQRNSVGMEINGTATTLGWGLWESFPITPQWNDGKSNYDYLLEHWYRYFKETAVQRCGLGRYGESLDIEKKESPFWYLSARDEMLRLYENYGSDETAHIKKNQYYWTSNEWLDRTVAVACKYDLSTKPDKRWETKKKKNEYYARQACHAE